MRTNDVHTTPAASRSEETIVDARWCAPLSVCISNITGTEDTKLVQTGSLTTIPHTDDGTSHSHPNSTLTHII